MPESWSEPPAFASRVDDSDSPRREGQRRSADPLEQRLDRLMSAGRQLVDGVSGARPGSRGRRPRLDGLGRWVENKLDWILEDDDDWREPWQETTRPEARPEPRFAQPSRRRPLDAISRRTPAATGPAPSQPVDPSAWPDDETFTVPRWQRQTSSPRSATAPSPPGGDGPTPGRAMPRSTRRR